MRIGGVYAAPRKAGHIEGPAGSSSVVRRDPRAPGIFVVFARNGLNGQTIAGGIGRERTAGRSLDHAADGLRPGRILWGSRAAVAAGGSTGGSPSGCGR